MQPWLRMREDCGLEGAESGPAITGAIEILEREIRASHLPNRPPAGRPGADPVDPS